MNKGEIMHFIKYLFVLCLVFVFSGCKIELSTPSEELKAVIQTNIDGMNSENVQASLDAVHSQSPFYEQMQVMLEEVAKVYDLESTLEDYQYVGMDANKEKAVVLVKQKTAKIDGPEFRDNIVEMMTVFKKDGEYWKIWQSLTLDVEYLD